MSDNERNCKNCAHANFLFSNAPVGSGRSNFWCGHMQKWPDYSTDACKDYRCRFQEATK